MISRFEALRDPPRLGLSRFFSVPGATESAAERTWQAPDGRQIRTIPANTKLKWNTNAEHRFLRDHILERDGHTCMTCGMIATPTTWQKKIVIDHAISIANGGSNHPLNLQLLCISCNSSKAGLIDAKRLTPYDCAPHIRIGKLNNRPFDDLDWISRAVYFEIARLTDGCSFLNESLISYASNIPRDVVDWAVARLIESGLVRRAEEHWLVIPLYEKEHAQ